MYLGFQFIVIKETIFYFLQKIGKTMGRLTLIAGKK